MIEHMLIALALHCHRGDILRVNLHRCVPKSSSLAREYVHHASAPPDKRKYYVQAVIQVRPDEVITDKEIAELAKVHVFIEPETSTPNWSLTFEQQSKLWRWLMSTTGRLQ